MKDQWKAPKKTATKSKPKTTKAPKVSKGLRTAIMKVMDDRIENKYISDQPLINALFNSGIASTNELYSCVPPIERGTEAHQRIGNSVQPRSCQVKGTISCAFDTLTSDVVVFMYVFTTKKFKHYPDVQANFNVANMLDNGLGATISPTGSIIASLFPHAKEHITLLAKKEFHLQKGYGSQNGGSSSELGVAGGSHTLSNFNIKIKCPVLKYDDNNGPRYPTNFAPVVGFGYYHTDGTIPDALSRVVLVNMSSQLYYEDA